MVLAGAYATLSLLVHAGRSLTTANPQTYLVLINLILFAFAIVLILAGVAIRRVTSDQYAVSSLLLVSPFVIRTFFAVSWFLHNTAILGKHRITLRRCGDCVASFLIIVTLSGSVGACTRHNHALKFYIFAMFVLFIAALGGGIYFLVKLRNNATAWDSVSVGDWSAFTDAEKDTYQVLFTCCGYTSTNASTIYTGVPMFESAYRTENSCADSAYVTAAAGCYDAGNAYYHLFTVVSGAIFAGILLFILTGIGAADQAKLRTGDVGYQVVNEGYLPQ
ncbi:hypothetical protein HDU83_006188 [Entophlyctis luteolus]|nr:hypothetical protein HDU83_006188 [Entophlyctis luteolus]